MHNAMMKPKVENNSTGNQRRNAALEELVKRAIGGNSDELFALVEEIAKGVLFRARHIMNNEMDAEDVSQEVLIHVCEKIRDLREPKAFKAWLGGIIINEAKRYMVKNAQRGIVLDIDDYLEKIIEQNDDFIPHDYAENEDTRKTVMGVISRLPRRQREAVILHYYDELSVTEVAEAMGVTHQSVSEYLALARKKLRGELEKQPILAKLGGMSALPMASAITGMLHIEAANFVPANASWLPSVLSQVNKYIVAETAAATTTAAKTPTTVPGAKMVMAIIVSATTLITALGLVLGITLGSEPQAPIDTMPIAHKVSLEGTILFSGGISYAGTDRVNPKQAQPQAKSTGGELTVLGWWITEAGNETILYEGYGDDVKDALTRIRKSGNQGEYKLFFNLTDESGAHHRLGGNFYILDLS